MEIGYLNTVFHSIKFVTWKLVFALFKKAQPLIAYVRDSRVPRGVGVIAGSPGLFPQMEYSIHIIYMDAENWRMVSSTWWFTHLINFMKYIIYSVRFVLRFDNFQSYYPYNLIIQFWYDLRNITHTTHIIGYSCLKVHTNCVLN